MRKALPERLRLRPIAVLVAVCLAAAAVGQADQATAASGERAEAIAKRTTRNLTRVLVKARDQLKQLARLSSVRTQDAAGCRAQMTARAGSPRYTALGAANREGDLYCLSLPTTTSINIADRAYFLRAVGNKGFGVGDYQIGRVTGQDSLGLGFAVLAGRRATGIVLSPLSLAWLDRRIERRFEAPAVQVLVTDDHGTVLAQAGRKRISVGTNLARFALTKAMLSKKRGKGVFRLGGRRVRAAFRTVPASQGALHVAVGVRP